MKQNNESDNNTTCDKTDNNKKIYFPISSENAYGVIPLLGAATSCFAVGIMQAFYEEHAWFGIWFFFGFLIYVGAQTFWGIHSKDQKYLQLWLACKGVEVLPAVAGILSEFYGGGPYIDSVVYPSILLLVLLAVLLHVGYTKLRHFKKLEKSNIFAIQCPDQITTKY